MTDHCDTTSDTTRDTTVDTTVKPLRIPMDPSKTSNFREMSRIIDILVKTAEKWPKTSIKMAKTTVSKLSKVSKMPLQTPWEMSKSTKTVVFLKFHEKQRF